MADSALMHFNQSFSTNKARLGDFAVYISGVRVPCQEVQVSNGMWQFPQATILVPPDPDLIRLGKHDRAHVVIFYLDSYYTPNKPEYRMIFEGEIMGWGYSKTGYGKSITFNAMGFPFVFTQFFLEFTTSWEASLFGHLSNEQGAGISPAILQLETLLPFSVFAKGFNSSEPVHNGKEFIDQFIDLMTGVGGPYPTKVGEDEPRIREFFKAFSSAYKLKSRVTPFKNIDDQFFNFIEEMEHLNFLKLVVHGLGQSISSLLTQGSVWDYIQMFFKVLYHELLMLSTPVDTTPTQDIITKPQTFFTAVPRCNVFFPSMIQNISFTEDYWASPTRSITRPLEGILGAVLGTSQSEAAPQMNKLMHTYVTGRNELDGEDPLKEIGLILRESSYTSQDTIPTLSSVITGEERARGPTVLNAEPELIYQWLAEKMNSGDRDKWEWEQIWIEYEHMKNRAMAAAGSVSLSFNPYVLPTFPCIVFDNMDDQVHMEGYIMSVSHVLSGNGFSTSVTMSATSALGKDGKTIRAPFMLGESFSALEPDTDSADSAIGEMFGRPRLSRGGLRASIQNEVPDNVFTSTVQEDGTIISQRGTKTNYTVEPSPFKNAIYHSKDILGKGVNKGSLDGLTDLGTICFKSHDYAMENYCNRPILTMDKYLAFHGGARWYYDKTRKTDNDTRGIPQAPDVLVDPDNINASTFERAIEQTASKDPQLPWRREGSLNKTWARQIINVAKKAAAHGIYVRTK